MKKFKNFKKSLKGRIDIMKINLLSNKKNIKINIMK